MKELHFSNLCTMLERLSIKHFTDPPSVILDDFWRLLFLSHVDSFHFYNKFLAPSLDPRPCLHPVDLIKVCAGALSETQYHIYETLLYQVISVINNSHIDFAYILQECLRTSDVKCKPQKLSLSYVTDFLANFYSLSDIDRTKAFKDLFHSCTPIEVKWVMRLLCKSMRLTLTDEEIIMKWHKFSVFDSFEPL
ncbi:hypothetical protein GEMRC1_010458 [Eukaryota sp. GEM-RC1]